MHELATRSSVVGFAGAGQRRGAKEEERDTIY